MVAAMVKDLVEEMFPSSMEIGKTLQHPDGRTVTITKGQYWGTYGLSNFWYWHEVFEDGSLGPEECGYGW